jgi:ketosteroid isomerase-like protein
MSAETHKTRIREAFAALNAGDGGRWLAAFRDDFVWKVSPNEVFPARAEGKAQVVQSLFVPLTQKLEGSPKIHIDELIAEGDRVVALAHGEATTKGGESYDQTYCFIFRFEGDEIVEVDERIDTALVNRVLA